MLLKQQAEIQHADHTTHKFFEICSRTVGNVALKRIWKAFIHAKLEYLSFEKVQEIIHEENLRYEMENNDFYAEMEDLDNEAKLKANKTNNKVFERDTDKISTTSIKSKVYSFKGNDSECCYF